MHALLILWIIGGLIFFAQVMHYRLTEVDQGGVFGCLPDVLFSPFILLFCLIGGPVGAFAFWRDWI